MTEYLYNILDVYGRRAAEVRMLVHIRDAEAPDDWESYKSAVVVKDTEGLRCEYKVEEWLMAMWQSPGGILYAISINDRVHWSEAGRDWQVTEIGKKCTFNDVWGLDEQHVYCCGLRGVLFEKSGDRWRRVDIGSDEALVRIRGTSPQNLYILGKRGKIFHYDGATFSEVDSPTNFQLLNVLCVSEDEVYVCGRKGVCFRGSRQGWERIDGTEFNLYSLASYEGKILVGAGKEGVLSVDGSSLVAFATVPADGLQIIGDRLFAFASSSLHEFNGTEWTSTEFDFETVLGS
jgi:hypothetical protein